MAPDEDSSTPTGSLPSSSGTTATSEIVPRQSPRTSGSTRSRARSRGRPRPPSAATPPAGRAAGASRTARMRGAGARRRSGGAVGAPAAGRARPSRRSPIRASGCCSGSSSWSSSSRSSCLSCAITSATAWSTVTPHTSPNSGQIAQASAALGTNLVRTMQNTSGQSPAQLQADLTALATEAGHQTQQAQGSRHALGRRRRQPRAGPCAPVPAGRAPGPRRRISRRSCTRTPIAPRRSRSPSSMQQFLASDVIVQDSYLSETAQALRNESITGVSVPSASAVTFLQGPNQNYVLASGAARLLSPLRHVGDGVVRPGCAAWGSAWCRSSPSPARSPSPPASPQTIPESSNLHWAVTVQNGGSFVENNIKVSASLSYGTTPVDVQTNTIASINPGQQLVDQRPGTAGERGQARYARPAARPGRHRPRRAEHRQQRRRLPDHGHLQLRSGR